MSGSSAPPPQPPDMSRSPDVVIEQRLEGDAIPSHIKRLIAAHEAKEALLDAADAAAESKTRRDRKSHEQDVETRAANSPKIEDVINPTTGERISNSNAQEQDRSRER